eukprot:NODE_2310_length_1214_cov_24.517019_g2197_i0.p1 GENE.NODE_2310_length_1214_cov_24.517019_g2197_i0~~NODE_2310_length_1214_cov_24.517019_g2197_i0.p1  ORF type:complete len:331 (-),score=84.21 NODE_2310_length_1214_cov_24.517019_g2197_i0:197-1189(-)
MTGPRTLKLLRVGVAVGGVFAAALMFCLLLSETQAHTELLRRQATSMWQSKQAQHSTAKLTHQLLSEVQTLTSQDWRPLLGLLPENRALLLELLAYNTLPPTATGGPRLVYNLLRRVLPVEAQTPTQFLSHLLAQPQVRTLPRTYVVVDGTNACLLPILGRRLHLFQSTCDTTQAWLRTCAGNASRSCVQEYGPPLSSKNIPWVDPHIHCTLASNITDNLHTRMDEVVKEAVFLLVSEIREPLLALQGAESVVQQYGIEYFLFRLQPNATDAVQTLELLHGWGYSCFDLAWAPSSSPIVESVPFDRFVHTLNLQSATTHLFCARLPGPHT